MRRYAQSRFRRVSELLGWRRVGSDDLGLSADLQTRRRDPSGEVFPHRVDRRLGTIGAPGLREDLSYVVVNRSLADVQAQGYREVGVAFGDETQYLDLPSGEPIRIVGEPPAQMRRSRCRS